jgi:hypothetical protein
LEKNVVSFLERESPENPDSQQGAHSMMTNPKAPTCHPKKKYQLSSVYSICVGMSSEGFRNLFVQNDKKKQQQNRKKVSLRLIKI